MKRVNYLMDSTNIELLYWIHKNKKWKTYFGCIYHWIFLGHSTPLHMLIAFFYDEQNNKPTTEPTKHKTRWFMPIVKFSLRDLNRGKPITPAWYRVKIDSIGEAPSADKGSTNFPVEGTILFNADNGTKDFEGYPLDWNFNSKAIGFAVGFLEALGVTVTPEQRFDLNAAVGNELDVFVENGEWQGRIVNRVNHKYRKPVQG